MEINIPEFNFFVDDLKFVAILTENIPA